MISVGIDVSKEKSTVCFMRPYGEVVAGPMEISHIDSELKMLVKLIKSMNDEVRIVMEATGNYHLPILSFMKDQSLFVSVINPYKMKQFRNQGLRRVKTDKADSVTIAQYGLYNWDSLNDYVDSGGSYKELSILSRQYRHYMEIHITALLGLTHLLDYAMPGIKQLLSTWNPENGKDKLSDFVEQYWHYDVITKKTEQQFVESYLKWAKKKGYHCNRNKAAKIYSLAKEGIPTLPADQTTKMLVTQAIEVLRRVDETLNTILTRMNEIAKSLPEYPVVRAMGGVGDVLAPRLIADIGDVRRFHSGKALIAYAGIDAPPYQSGSL